VRSVAQPPAQEFDRAQHGGARVNRGAIGMREDFAHCHFAGLLIRHPNLDARLPDDDSKLGRAICFFNIGPMGLRWFVGVGALDDFQPEVGELGAKQRQYSRFVCGDINDDSVANVCSDRR